MAAWFTRGRLSRMLPLLSITKPMLTGMSSRLKTESFCSTLSSSTRKLSCFRPSAKRPRSSITVVCSTTRLTSTRILESWPTLGWPGGGGGALGTAGICASATPRPKRRVKETTRVRKAWRDERDARSVAGSVVARFRVHVEGRKPLGRAELDLDLSPARVMRLIAWTISQDILVSQLHADFRCNVRKFVQILDRENAAARHFRNFAQQRRTVEFFRRTIAVTKRVKDANGIELGVGFLYETLDVAFIVPTMIISPVG